MSYKLTKNKTESNSVLGIRLRLLFGPVNMTRNGDYTERSVG